MRRMLSTLIAATALLSAGGAGGVGSSTVVERPSLTLDGARRVIAAIVAEAGKNKVGGAIAVVDDGGNLMAMERLDGTFAAAAQVSIGKARTAAMFKRPTKFFEEVITTKGRTSMIALDDFTPLQGGVPLIVNDQVIGAVGVSGAASAQQDEEFANIGAMALQAEGLSMSAMTAPMPTTFFSSVDVTAAFAQGRPLIENNRLKVHASRREKPGQAEVHEHETDVIYVLQGSATVVTGGQVVDGKSTGEGEIRGASIANGQSQQLKPGDVMVVPAGTPHWFKIVDGSTPFLYYVVKVIS